MFNIPTHTRCINCGDCCGPVPIDEKELKEIKEKIDTLEPSMIRFVLGQKRPILTCPFRDVANKSCIIYSHRPMLCRLMGITAGMRCSNGNSHNLDMYHLVKGNKSAKIMFEAVRYLKDRGDK